ncbi:hypothetical protein SAMN06269117_11458 [Balnearium lithotrophicum]|uniref:Uncharacterized protein n=1 Tax=Balnearium lithotrophicum TaxID=223788 RepID=A0A521CTI4_9BACT|nr:hypothetical protein [Balnearium lithotrophicum]SMO61950.1 hypothetical protein SAMN06269117_11458 [Balnearium lithotrophicum]
MLTDERNVFYEDFGVDVAREDGSTFRAVPFDEETFSDEIVDGRATNLVEFYLRAKMEEVETLSTGERLTVNGETYYVAKKKVFRGLKETFIYLSRDAVNETI